MRAHVNTWPGLTGKKVKDCCTRQDKETLILLPYTWSSQRSMQEGTSGGSTGKDNHISGYSSADVNNRISYMVVRRDLWWSNQLLSFKSNAPRCNTPCVIGFLLTRTSQRGVCDCTSYVWSGHKCTLQQQKIRQRNSVIRDDSLVAGRVELLWFWRCYSDLASCPNPVCVGGIWAIVREKSVAPMLLLHVVRDDSRQVGGRLWPHR